MAEEVSGNDFGSDDAALIHLLADIVEEALRRDGHSERDGLKSGTSGDARRTSDEGSRVRPDK